MSQISRMLRRTVVKYEPEIQWVILIRNKLDDIIGCRSRKNSDHTLLKMICNVRKSGGL